MPLHDAPASAAALGSARSAALTESGWAMHRTAAHGTRTGRGQAMVEMAIVLPVFLLFLMGMVDFGRGLLFGTAVQGGSREAGRVASQVVLNGDTDDAIVTRLINASWPAMVGLTPPASGTMCSGGCALGTDGFGVSWTVTVTTTPSRSSGDSIEVKTVGSMPLLFGLIASRLGISTIDVHGDAVFVLN